MLSSFFQSLENRSMMSASTTVDPAVLLADKAQYQADVLTLTKDTNTKTNTLQADRAKVAADLAAVAESKTAAATKLAADQKIYMAELKANGDKGTPIYTKWQSVLEADKAAIKADGDKRDAKATDQAKYDADYKAFREEMAPVEAATKAIIAKWTPRLATDKQATENGTAELLAKMKKDQEQLGKDETYFKTLLAQDQKKIDADIKKYKADGGTDGGDKKVEPTKPEPAKPTQK